jgi:hypothetical protein
MTIQKRVVVNTILRAAVVIAVVLVSARPAAAQVSKGLNEIGGLVKYQNEDARSEFDTDIFYGRLITDRVQLGAGWQMYKATGENAEGSFHGFGAYYFGKPGVMTAPYVLVRAGKHYGSDTGTPTFVGGGAGIKYFLGQNGALNMAALVQRDFADGDVLASTGFGMSVGASIFFK